MGSKVYQFFFYASIINSIAYILILISIFVVIKNIMTRLKRYSVWLLYVFFIFVVGSYAIDSTKIFYKIMNSGGDENEIVRAYFYFYTVLPYVMVLFGAFLCVVCLNSISRNEPVINALFLSLLLFLIMGATVVGYILPLKLSH